MGPGHEASQGRLEQLRVEVQERAAPCLLMTKYECQGSGRNADHAVAPMAVQHYVFDVVSPFSSGSLSRQSRASLRLTPDGVIRQLGTAELFM